MHDRFWISVASYRQNHPGASTAIAELVIQADEPRCDMGGAVGSFISWTSVPLDLRDVTGEESVYNPYYTGYIITLANDDADEEIDNTDNIDIPPPPSVIPETEDSEDGDVETLEDPVVTDDSVITADDVDNDGVPNSFDSYPDQEEIWDGSRALDGIEDGRYTGPTLTTGGTGQGATTDQDGDGFINNIDSCPTEPGAVDGCPEGSGGAGGTGAGAILRFSGNGPTITTAADGGSCSLEPQAGVNPLGMLIFFSGLFALFLSRGGVRPRL